MKKEIMPDWSKGQKAEGERTGKAWDEFFSSAEKEKKKSNSPFLNRSEEVKIAQVRARHESQLLGYPNVVGLGEGIKTKQGKPTGEPCIVVSVNRKIPSAKLDKNHILPSQIEGISIDVVEVGQVKFL